MSATVEIYRGWEIERSASALEIYVVKRKRPGGRVSLMSAHHTIADAKRAIDYFESLQPRFAA